MSTTVLELDPIEVAVDQRGRAELEFIVAMGAASGGLRKKLADTLTEAGLFDGDFTDIETLRAETDAVIENMPEFRLQHALGSWNQATPRSVATFHRNKETLLPFASGAEHLVEDRIGDSDVPRYWDYEFHGTTGGWDGHEHMGFVHHEMVYRWMLRAFYGNNIFELRRQVAAAAPRDDYRRILDLGSGTGQYSMQIQEVYPDADLTLIDISRAELNYALKRGQEAGHSWRGIRAAAEETGLPDESFDLVTSFILLHEVPPHVTKKVLAEAFRLLEPGGHIVFSDVTPYREGTKEMAWSADYAAAYGNEPWWRTAATLNLTDIATEIGYVNVQETGLNGQKYPWLLIAEKPGR
ncbi:class I SAM-dependent methyltransferase [uncultured Microbacterium sp.]|uniref:class I SAM-dependent methyltransferase n=1 Tax=uncultured Microbacterium sp. TaxID=191216 RepID=UPI002603B287|nr:class I SAM-dependent methyltransferase [uncultured Microbacterium sp.]